MRVCDAGARADHATFADDRFTFNCDVRIDDCVAANLSFGADVCVRWIDKRHAAFDHQFADCRSSQQILKFRQFGARVDAGYLAVVVVKVDTHTSALGENDFGNVSQVVLTLIVGRLTLRKARNSSLASKQ